MAEHLIHELGAVKVAVIESIFFPPQVIIGEDGTVRLANNELYHYSGDAGNYLFLVGDYQSTSAEGHYLLADTYLEIAESLGVKMIYTLGGYGVGHLVRNLVCFQQSTTLTFVRLSRRQAAVSAGMNLAEA